jgi:hypothetical protein
MEILAGIFMIITSIIIAAAFLTKMNFLSFFSSISEDYEYLTDNTIFLQINSLLWILSTLLIIAFSGCLWAAMKTYDEASAGVTSLLFIISSILFIVAGINGLTIIEIMENQVPRMNDQSGKEFLKAYILNLTNERAMYIQMAIVMACFGLFVFGLFGIISRRIPFLARKLLLAGGFVLPISSLLFKNSMLQELSVAFLLLSLLLIGTRLAFKGLILKTKKVRIKENAV